MLFLLRKEMCTLFPAMYTYPTVNRLNNAHEFTVIWIFKITLLRVNLVMWLLHKIQQSRSLGSRTVQGSQNFEKNSMLQVIHIFALMLLKCHYACRYNKWQYPPFYEIINKRRCFYGMRAWYIDGDIMTVAATHPYQNTFDRYTILNQSLTT